MKKPVKVELPICAKCKKTLEPRFTTEIDDDAADPSVLILYGVCDDCEVITMANVIKIEDIPTTIQ